MALHQLWGRKLTLSQLKLGWHRVSVTRASQAELQLLLHDDLCNCSCAFAHKAYAYIWKSQMCKILHSIYFQCCSQNAEFACWYRKCLNQQHLYEKVNNSISTQTDFLRLNSGGFLLFVVLTRDSFTLKVDFPLQGEQQFLIGIHLVAKCTFICKGEEKAATLSR